MVVFQQLRHQSGRGYFATAYGLKESVVLLLLFFVAYLWLQKTLQSRNGGSGDTLLQQRPNPVDVAQSSRFPQPCNENCARQVYSPVAVDTVTRTVLQRPREHAAYWLVSGLTNPFSILAQVG